MPNDNEYVSQDFILLLEKYCPHITPNKEFPDGIVRANPEWQEMVNSLWFAATGKAFPIED